MSTRLFYHGTKITEKNHHYPSGASSLSNRNSSKRSVKDCTSVRYATVHSSLQRSWFEWDID